MPLEKSSNIKWIGITEQLRTFLPFCLVSIVYNLIFITLMILKDFLLSFIITISFYHACLPFLLPISLYPLKQSNTHAQHTFLSSKFCLGLNSPPLREIILRFCNIQKKIIEMRYLVCACEFTWLPHSIVERRIAQTHGRCLRSRLVFPSSAFASFAFWAFFDYVFYIPLSFYIVFHVIVQLTFSV